MPRPGPKIKQHSVKSPAVITIAGFADGAMQSPVSGGAVSISTSADPVGAPIFYRDVSLMLWPRNEKGAIQPLPQFAIPLIKWKLRNLGETESHTVTAKLIVPTAKEMAIRNEDVARVRYMF
jgi:hypothetical protein